MNKPLVEMTKKQVQDVAFKYGFDASYDGKKRKYVLSYRIQSANKEAVCANLHLAGVIFTIKPYSTR